MISASILACNFSSLGSELVNISLDGAEMIHFDVMDGTFVPNISFGFPILEVVRRYTSLEIEAHLMIQNPINHIKTFAEHGVNSIIIHPETVPDLKDAIRLIKNEQVKVGIALSPDFPVDSLDYYLPDIDQILIMSVSPGFGAQDFLSDSLKKIKHFSNLKTKKGLPHLLIGVDGGINDTTAAPCWEAGADYLVSGSYLFNQSDRRKAIQLLNEQKKN